MTLMRDEDEKIVYYKDKLHGILTGNYFINQYRNY